MNPISPLPQMLEQLILDEVVATIDYTEEERGQFYAQLCREQAYLDWLQQQGVTPDQFEMWLDRELCIRKFQQQQWGRTLFSYFLQRKYQLDRVVCSLIYLRDAGLAQELYFRIDEGEQSFAEVARAYSLGAEADIGGRVGPIALGELPPTLARMFYGSRPGQLWAPTQVENWVVIARLEEWLPVQIDETMRQMLLNDLLEDWLQDKLQERFPSG